MKTNDLIVIGEVTDEVVTGSGVGHSIEYGRSATQHRYKVQILIDPSDEGPAVQVFRRALAALKEKTGNKLPEKIKLVTEIGIDS
jgi:hypothetical protein